MPRLYNFKHWGPPPHEIFDDYEEICSLPWHARDLGMPELGRRFTAAFERAVAETWDPAKWHIVLHSSGYDSRHLSQAIKKLGLRDFEYVCMEPEQDEFVSIVNYLGVPDWLVLGRQGANPTAVSVEVAWETCPEKHRFRSGDVQVYSCGYFDELASYSFFKDAADNRMADWIDKYYNFKYAHNAAEFPGEVVYPLLHPAPISVLFSHRFLMDKPFKIELARNCLDPKLFAFPRYQDLHK
jgi:hypothetical protein